MAEFRVEEGMCHPEYGDTGPASFDTKVNNPTAVADADVLQETYKIYVAMLEGVPQIKEGEQRALGQALIKNCNEVQIVYASGFNGMFGSWNRVTLLCSQETLLQCNEENTTEVVLHGQGGYTITDNREIDSREDVNNLKTQIEQVITVETDFTKISMNKEYDHAYKAIDTWQRPSME